MFDAATFSKSVFDLRQSCGLSLREMAHHVGISAATLSRIERGHKPDIDSFIIICQWAGEGWENISDFAVKISLNQTQEPFNIKTDPFLL